MIKSVYWSSRKVIVIVVISCETLIFSTDCPRILKFLISWKSFRRKQICPMEQTDRETLKKVKLIVACSKFLSR